ncbi:hypothetical protein D3C71_152770 [compost metagenome]
MSKTIDMKALVAHLTDTALSTWEPYMGRKEGIGTEETFIEVGDFGPWDEDVADMIREGYTSGQRWQLTTDIDLDDNDAAAHEIARLVDEGYTSGIEPSWSIEINKIHPREVYVCIDDGDVTVTISGTEEHEAIDFDSTIDDLANSPDTASLVKDADQPMKM